MDFWISDWISGFQFEFLPTVYKFLSWWTPRIHIIYAVHQTLSFSQKWVWLTRPMEKKKRPMEYSHGSYSLLEVGDFISSREGGTDLWEWVTGSYRCVSDWESPAPMRVWLGSHWQGESLKLSYVTGNLSKLTSFWSERARILYRTRTNNHHMETSVEKRLVAKCLESCTRSTLYPAWYGYACAVHVVSMVDGGKLDAVPRGVLLLSVSEWVSLAGGRGAGSSRIFLHRSSWKD